CLFFAKLISFLKTITSLAPFFFIYLWHTSCQELKYFWGILAKLFKTHLIGEFVVCNELGCNSRHYIEWYVEYRVVTRLICGIQIILSGRKFNSKKNILIMFATSWSVKVIGGLEEQNNNDIAYVRSL